MVNKICIQAFYHVFRLGFLTFRHRIGINRFEQKLLQLQKARWVPESMAMVSLLFSMTELTNAAIRWFFCAPVTI